MALRKDECSGREQSEEQKQIVRKRLRSPSAVHCGLSVEKHNVFLATITHSLETTERFHRATFSR